MDNEDSNQTVQMHRIICGFVGYTVMMSESAFSYVALLSSNGCLENFLQNIFFWALSLLNSCHDE